MIGLILISLALFFFFFILAKGNLKQKFLSIVLFSCMLLSGYYWFLYGLRVKENNKVYFIENRHGEYANYSEAELNRELEIEVKNHKERKMKMNISAVIFIVCIVGLALESVIILKLFKFRRIN